jgi:hypothetical protein
MARILSRHYTGQIAGEVVHAAGPRHCTGADVRIARNAGRVGVTAFHNAHFKWQLYTRAIGQATRADSTFAEVIHGYTRSIGFAFVPVGHTITSAYRSPDGGTIAAHLSANANHARIAA